MKTLKSFLLVALMTVLVPVASSAILDDVVCGLFPCDTTPPPPSVPEPSGALIMGAALLTLAVVRRQARK